MSLNVQGFVWDVVATWARTKDPTAPHFHSTIVVVVVVVIFVVVVVVVVFVDVGALVNRLHTTGLHIGL